MAHFADHAQSFVADVIANGRIARDTMRLRIAIPQGLPMARPGQFMMLRNVRGSDPLIGRAFALYDADPDGHWIDLVYLVKGKLTSQLQFLKACDQVGLCGPLGNAFDATATDHLIMVAGGIGQTPFLCLAKEALGLQHFGDRPAGYTRQVSLCYGVRSREYLAGVESFQQLGIDVHLATEDGSAGHHGRVTELLRKLIERHTDRSTVRLACCGPEPMMAAVSKIASDYQVRCQVSLETPMACGIGICFTCVAKIGCADSWDYKRTCVEGPIFDSSAIVW